MSEAVIAALITGVCAVIAQAVLGKSNQQKIMSELDKRSELKDTELRGELAVLRTELTALRSSVDKHNTVIDRTYKLETEVAKQGEQIKTLFNNR